MNDDIEEFNQLIEKAREQLEGLFDGVEEKRAMSDVLTGLKKEGETMMFGELYHHDFAIARKTIEAVMRRLKAVFDKYDMVASRMKAIVDARDMAFKEEMAKLEEQHLDLAKDAVRVFREAHGLKPKFDFLEGLERSFFTDGRSREDQAAVRQFQWTALMYSVMEHGEREDDLRTIEAMLKAGEIELLIGFARYPRGYVIPPTEGKETHGVEKGRESRPGVSLDEKDFLIIEYINKNQGATAKDIMAILGLSRNGVLDRLNKLVKRKLLKKIPGEGQFKPDIYEPL